MDQSQSLHQSSSSRRRSTTTNKHGQKTRQILFLPEELIRLILARVPAKSLLRFMAVCKLWRSTICDPKFTEFHRRNSDTRMGGNYFASFEHLPPSVWIRFMDHRGGSESVPRPIELNYAHFLSPFLRGVWASRIFNGLVYFRFGLQDLILNITTREILDLPESNIRGVHIHRHRYIIGYDPATEKYKVFHYARRNDEYGFEEPMCEVFTLGSTEWRYTTKPPGMILKSRNNSQCVNGKIYWLTRSGGERFLISFDVGGEIFHAAKFSLPLKDVSNLFSLGGNILAVVQFCGYGAIEVWKMEVCNNNHELKVLAERTIRFPFSEISSIIRDPLVLGISPTGEIVLTDNGSVRKIYFLDLDFDLDDDSEVAAWRVEYWSQPMDNKVCHSENMLRLRNPM